MSTAYFANSVYGVAMSKKEHKQLDAWLAAALAESASDDREPEYLSDLPESEVDDLVEAALDRHKDEIVSMLARHGLAPDAAVFYTGIEDHRAGKSRTPTELWLAGYGLMAFPLPAEQKLSEKFCTRAKWHTWVTCSG